MSTLALAWRDHPDTKELSPVSARRYHLDFLVNDRSLFEEVHADEYGLIGCLGWAADAQEQETLQQLLLETPALVPGDRRMLFVCSHCGDLGCGAITAIVAYEDGLIWWRDFAYENNYDARMTETQRFERVGPFSFEPQHYRSALSARPPGRPRA